MDKKLPKSEKKDHQADWYSKLYFQYVETVAAARRHNREKRITEWMEADEQKDRRLATSHMAKTPYYRIYGKDMEQFIKDYMPRRLYSCSFSFLR